MDDDRRKFCKYAGLAVVGAALPAGCLNGGGGGNPADIVNAGKTSDVLLNDYDPVQVPGHNIMICRDAGGLYAMSLNCTHARCILTFANDTAPMFTCNCHGSTFDYNGQHPTAPASQPLDHYKLTVDSAGNMTVDTGTIVDPSTRTQG
jgi:Rieske Fe-S protein